MMKKNDAGTEDDFKLELMRLGIYLKNLFEANGIWYCLAVGSLLGAVRHDGFIPWDSDLDFHIKVTDVDRVRELIMQNPLEDTFLQVRGKHHCTNSHDYLVSKKFKKCHVDLYQLIGVPEQEFKRKTFCYICYFCDMAFRHKHINIFDCKKQNQKKAFVVKLITQIVPDYLIEYIYKKIETAYDYGKSKFVKSLCSVYVPHDCVMREGIEKTFQHKFENTEFMIPQAYDDYLTHMYGDYMTPVKY